MIRVYTIGHPIPEKVKEVISEWNYWEYIVVASTEKKNRDAKEVIQRLQPDEDKVLQYKTPEGLEVYVCYTYNQK